MTTKTVGDVFIDINNILYCGAGRCHRVDIAVRIVTITAVGKMGGLDIGPGTNGMTIRAWLRINHTKVGQRINRHRVVNNAAGVAVVVCVEISWVTDAALAAA